MGFDFELKYTPGEQISHTGALSRIHFDDDDENSWRHFKAATQAIRQQEITFETEKFRVRQN